MTWVLRPTVTGMFRRFIPVRRTVGAKLVFGFGSVIALIALMGVATNVFLGELGAATSALTANVDAQEHAANAESNLSEAQYLIAAHQKEYVESGLEDAQAQYLEPARASVEVAWDSYY